MSAKNVRIGMVGAGGIANYQARFICELPYAKIVGVADVAEDKARDFARRWGVPEENVFEDYAEMYESLELDAVSICTPHAVHYDPAVKALGRGLHVLVEKPMAARAQEAYEMWRLSKEKGRILMVGFQTRFSPELIAARRIVAAGLLGRIYYSETTLGGRRRGIPGPTFTTKKLAGGGVTLDLGCYSLDTAMYVLGFPIPRSVTAFTSSYIGASEEAVVLEAAWPWDPRKFEVEDFVAAFVRFEDGSVLVLKESWAMHADTLGSTFFLGSRGGLRLSPLELYRDELGYMTNTTFKLRQSGYEDWFRDKIRAFIDAVRSNATSPINPAEIVLEQFILDAVYESAAKGGEVSVKVPADLRRELGK